MVQKEYQAIVEIIEKIKETYSDSNGRKSDVNVIKKEDEPNEKNDKAQDIKEKLFLVKKK